MNSLSFLLGFLMVILVTLVIISALNVSGKWSDYEELEYNRLINGGDSLEPDPCK